MNDHQVAMLTLPLCVSIGLIWCCSIDFDKGQLQAQSSHSLESQKLRPNADSSTPVVDVKGFPGSDSFTSQGQGSDSSEGSAFVVNLPSISMNLSASIMADIEQSARSSGMDYVLLGDGGKNSD